MFKFEKKIDLNKTPLTINYYNDGSLIINNDVEKELIKSAAQKIKRNRIIKFFINNLSIKYHN